MEILPRKCRMVVRFIGFFLVCLSMCWAGFAGAEALQVRADTSPSLSDKEIGHLRLIMKLADQPPGDWSNMGGLEPGQEADDAYRYQLAFMAYALGLAQYHKTPAYRELYQRGIDAVIQKMLRRDVWGYWEQTSQGGKRLNPDQKEPRQGWIDPVVRENIMYSGHLLQMVSLYEMLYRDRKYDEPGSLTFNYEPMFRGFGPQKFAYDHHSLAKVIHKQFQENHWLGIACEPNLIFIPCNQHPILGFTHFDYIHGANFAAQIKPRYKQAWGGKGAVHYAEPGTHKPVFSYMVQQDKVVYEDLPIFDGWVGAFMHAWDKEAVESAYPGQAERRLHWFPDGTATVPTAEASLMAHASDFGFFIILTAEVGDKKATDAMLAYADKHFTPVWQDGALYYPRNDDANRYITRVLGNALLPFARMNVKDGVWALYNRPWGDDYFTSPYISQVPYPKAIVKQAYYEPAQATLVVTLVPGTDDTGGIAFAVNQLDQSKNYSIVKDEETLGQFQKGTLRLAPGVKSIEQKPDGTLTISTDLVKPHTFLIRAEKNELTVSQVEPKNGH